MLQPQLCVTWAEAMATGCAMEVGAFEPQRPQRALKGFLAPASVACQLAAPTPNVRPSAVGVIGIEALLDCAASQMERLATNRGFQSFQVEVLHALASQQRFDIPENLSGEQTGERGFF